MFPNRAEPWFASVLSQTAIAVHLCLHEASQAEHIDYNLMSLRNWAVPNQFTRRNSAASSLGLRSPLHNIFEFQEPFVCIHSIARLDARHEVVGHIRIQN